MLTRIAGNCYWMARQLERAENNARLLRMAEAHAVMPEAVSGEGLPLWQTALEVSGALDSFMAQRKAQSQTQSQSQPEDGAQAQAQSQAQAEAESPVERGAVLRYLVLERDNPSSIISCLKSARDNARSARNLLTDAAWEAVNDTWLEAQALDEARLAELGVEGLVGWTIRRTRLVWGCFEDLWRDALPHVLDLGESVERADFTARILAEMLPALLADGVRAPAIGSPLFRRWQLLLSGLGLLEAWRRSTANTIAPIEVLRLSLVHPHDPHSLLVAVRRIAAAIEGATGRSDGRALAVARRLEGTVLAADLDELPADELPAFCQSLTTMTNEIGVRALKDHLS
ncbi:MAG: alpha-E domain-containing protein [Planctomycetes bacterium]|nr:alpha-E domain-containing protein [Planctomycetota bacterium]